MHSAIPSFESFRSVNEVRADSASGWLAIRGQWYSRLAGLVDAVADDLADRFGPLESSDLLASSTEDTRILMTFARPGVGMYDAAMTAAAKWLKPKEVSNVPGYTVTNVESKTSGDVVIHVRMAAR